jgi:hypothetical protein
MTTAFQQAVSGKNTAYFRGVERLVPGQPRGDLLALPFITSDSRVQYGWNRSTEISKTPGERKGLPGALTGTGKNTFRARALQNALSYQNIFGKAIDLTELSAGVSTLARFRPRLSADDSDYRSVWDLTDHGTPGIGCAVTHGRRSTKLIHAIDGGSKPILMTEDYSPAILGDTISGFPVPATANTGTYAGRIATRGRRPKDTDFNDGNSLYIKCTVAGVNPKFVAKYGIFKGDGTVPAGAFSAVEFTLKPAVSGGSDGWVTALLTAGKIGIFGEDNQPYQISASPDPVSSDLSTIAVGDIWEIPAKCATISQNPVLETRLSSFQTFLTLDGERIVYYDKLTVELDQKFAVQNPGGTRYAHRIDREGDFGCLLNFEDRYFDNYMRDILEASKRATAYVDFRNQAPIEGGGGEQEGIEIYASQLGIAKLDEGAISGPNIENSKANTMAEEPDDPTPGPDGPATWLGGGGPYFNGEDAVQINVTIALPLATVSPILG